MKIKNKYIADALRILSVDMVDNANSGHPGAPLGMADIAERLFFSEMKHNPQNPKWFNRDRVIFSNGHACALLYGMLHLAGYENFTIEELKKFRQLGSITHGHPELEVSGIELTTGPLGQGVANAVGMALAEKILATRFNRENYNIVDNYIYTFLGEGCLMEGLSHEACSLAGTLKLNKLILLMDRNKISIDGNTDKWFNEDIAMRFRAYGFNVIDLVDGHDSEDIEKALKEAKKEKEKPTIIIFNTTIGYGCGELCGTEHVHGSPLKDVEVLRKNIGWEHLERFYIPNEIRDEADLTEKGEMLEQEWNELFSKYSEQYPKEASDFLRIVNETGLANVDELAEKILNETIDNYEKPMASRSLSQVVLTELLPNFPEMFGGSADLSKSNLTITKFAKSITDGDFAGSYASFGVREFGMFSILNGMSVYAGFITFGGTFLVFLDYAKSALRSAAIMKTGVIYVLTHDSIGLGEDGKTHQPVEHLAMIRTIPNVEDWRPCNYQETFVSWIEAIKNRTKPTALVLSRQNINAFNKVKVADVQKGGYIFKAEDNSKPIDLVIIATGSEIELAIEVSKKSDKNIRIVSIPSFTRFFANDESYINSIIPSLSKKLIIEMGSSALWYRVKGEKEIVGIDTFGESGKAVDLFKKFGFTVDSILENEVFKS